MIERGSNNSFFVVVWLRRMLRNCLIQTLEFIIIIININIIIIIIINYN